MRVTRSAVRFASRRPSAALALVAPLLCLSACKPAGDGELQGVRYHLALQGSYAMVPHGDHEQVWVPSDDDRPFVAVHFGPRSRTNGKVDPCEPETHVQGTAQGAFYFVRKGDSVDMVTAAPPRGVTVSESRCLPPGENTISCSANYADGEMPADREVKARAICASFVVR